MDAVGWEQETVEFVIVSPFGQTTCCLPVLPRRCEGEFKREVIAKVAREKRIVSLLLFERCHTLVELGPNQTANPMEGWNDLASRCFRRNAHARYERSGKAR